MNRLAKKVAIVTGSTRGLGEAIAIGLAAEGARVAVTGRSAEGGQKVVKTITDAGGTASYFRLDLSDETSVRSCVREVTSHFGALHVLVNNAAPMEHVIGATHGMDGSASNRADNSIAEITTQGWRNILGAGLDGLFWMLRYSIPEMRKSGRGSIINISSNASILAVTGLDAYTATKGAMNSLTRSIALNYAPQIRCNCVIAGPFMTASLAPTLESHPSVRRGLLDSMLVEEIAEPSAIAPAVVFFASDESWYCTGQLLPVDGGQSARLGIPRLYAQ